MMKATKSNDRCEKAPKDSVTPEDTLRTTSVSTSAPPHDRAATDCCSTGLWGWSPPLLPADTPLKHRVDAVLPRSGLSVILFFGSVIVLLNVASLFPIRAELASIGLASLAAGVWCALNAWRCRHAHCFVTGSGWLALAGFAFIEAALGRSLIDGEEGLVFVAVLLAGLVFEAVWSALHGTNVVSPSRQ